MRNLFIFSVGILLFTTLGCSSLGPERVSRAPAETPPSTEPLDQLIKKFVESWQRRQQNVESYDKAARLVPVRSRLNEVMASKDLSPEQLDYLSRADLSIADTINQYQLMRPVQIGTQQIAEVLKLMNTKCPKKNPVEISGETVSFKTKDLKDTWSANLDLQNREILRGSKVGFVNNSVVVSFGFKNLSDDGTLGGYGMVWFNRDTGEFNFGSVEIRRFRKKDFFQDVELGWSSLFMGAPTPSNVETLVWKCPLREEKNG